MLHPHLQARERFARDAGPSTDLHALGVVLYGLATGRNPFRAETPKDPARRFPSARALADLLGAPTMGA